MARILKISGFLFVSFFLCGLPVLNAQDINPMGSSRSISLGVNLAGVGNKIINEGHNVISFVSRFNLRETLFLFGEAGFENMDLSLERYNYNSNGSFLRLGVEFDVLDNARGTGNDNLLVGIKYGFALQEHGASSFTISNGYWDDYIGTISPYALTSHWLELSGGPRAEVFRNFFMSWKIHLRVLAASTNSGSLKPYNIPGFGNGTSRVSPGISYTLEYVFPWNR